MVKLSIHGANIKQSKLLSRSNRIFHGFTTRNVGDLDIRNGDKNNTNRFWLSIGISPKHVVGVGQIHGINIAIIHPNQCGLIVPSADGGITQDQKITLAINTADCLPILMYSDTIAAIAAVHAGWRGTLGKILPEAFNKFLQLGSTSKDIQMAVGPHIAGCCYCITNERAQLFINAFGKDEKMIYADSLGLHLDIAYTVWKQAQELGIEERNIDVLLSCTSCQNKQYFSYRKEGKLLGGEMVSFISML